MTCEFTASRFFALDGTSHSDLWDPDEPVWELLGRLGRVLDERLQPNVALLPRQGGMVERTVVLHEGAMLSDGFEIRGWDALKDQLVVTVDGERLAGASVVCAGAHVMDGAVEIGPGVLLEPGCYVRGPTRIGACSEIRQGAYIRGDALVGRGCVVGHATEVKNSVFLDGARAGHFAYVGDSILGFDVNLGAGTKLANLKIVPGTIRVKSPQGIVDTGRRKLGAILGDRTQTGCNSVTSPGTLLGPETLVHPNVTVPGGLHLDHKTFRR